MTVYLRLKPADEAVYQFLDKKRAEGKPYYVYMTASSNKFLRIYYARVKECMTKLPMNAPIHRQLCYALFALLFIVKFFFI